MVLDDNIAIVMPPTKIVRSMIEHSVSKFVDVEQAHLGDGEIFNFSSFGLGQTTQKLTPANRLET